MPTFEQIERYRKVEFPDLCPGCDTKFANARFMCSACWFMSSANDRGAVYAMWRKKEDVTTKVAKMVRCVRAKRGLPLPAPLPSPAVAGLHS